MAEEDHVRLDMSNSKTADKAETTDHQPSLISLFAFTGKKHLAVFFPALALTILAGAVKPTIAIFLGYIFNDLTSFGAGNATETELLRNISTWCIALTGLGLATMLVNGGFFSLWLVFGEMQARSVRGKIFLGMLEKEMEWYDLCEDGIGSLMIRIQTQVKELQIATSQPLGFIIEDTAAALAALGIAFYYAWNLTLVILCCVPITLIILSVITRKLQPAIEAQKNDLADASRYSNTAITAVDTVKVFNGQDQEIWQYACSIKKAAKSYMVQAKVNSMQMGIARFMTTGMFVVGFWYGVVLVKQGFGPGSVLTTFYSCLMATQAAEALLPQWLVLSKGMAAGKTLRDILMQMERGRRVSKMMGSLKPTTCSGDVEVSNVTFSYPSNPRQLALSSASLFFPAGETTFVIGRSGSGKSTLGNLLMKYYQPSSGNLLIDGQSIQTLDLYWLRNNIALIQQQTVLFNETIFRNIALGRERHTLVTKDDVKMVCQTAMLQQMINDLPDGLDTMVGSGDNSMSGGQKQRVAIARACLRNTPILIMDEATSALDHISSSLVMDAIRHWRRSKTTIIITHDISQILDNDYVYILDRGKVVQEGYRNRLLENHDGPFASFLPPDADDAKSPAEESLRDTIDSKGIKESSADSIATDASEDASLETEFTSRLRRVSTFLGFGEEALGKGQGSNQRTPRGLGIASVHASNLRAEHIRGAQARPATARPYDLSKPLPVLPPDREIRRSYYPEDRSSNILHLGVELMELRGETTIKSRSHAPKASRSLQVLPTDLADPNSNIITLLTPKRQSRNDRNQPQERPTNRKRIAPLVQILGTVWPNLLRRDQATLMLGFVFSFISAASTPAFSYILARLLSTFTMTSGQSEEAEKWALSILGIAVVDGLSSYYMHCLLEYCGQIWVDTLRVEALKRILAQPRAWFDKEKNNPGRLNECLDRNAEEMRNLVGRFAGYVFLAASMMSIAIVWAFIVCWKLTLVGLASGPCMYAFTRAFEAVSGKWEKRVNEKAEVTGNIFTEIFSNIRVVRALTLEDYFKQKHSKSVVKTYNVGVRRAAYTGLFFGMSDSTNSFVTALILYYGAVIAASGTWSIDSVLLVITLLLFSSGNTNSVIAFIPQISSSRATASYMLYLANMPKTASHESYGTKHLASPFPVQLRSLSFAYPSRPNVEVLHKVSMTFESGSCTAIVGSSGCGKSTIASLLLGLYPPDESLHCPTPSLTFAGTSIFACNMPALRNHIALVSQTPILFPCTIAENIAYGLHELSELRHTFNIRAAAREAGIHDFIMSLPQGYETKVGDGGQGLSGGQTQKVSIARALIRRPKILILDEATSALDSESAKIIRATIARLVNRPPSLMSRLARSTPWNAEIESMENTAVIIITHNVEMMKVAEKIIMLDQGHVVEQGGFEELSRRGGPFSKLVADGEYLRGHGV